MIPSLPFVASREQLVAHREQEEEDLEGGGVARPDLLATTRLHHARREDTEGQRLGDVMVSPVMRRRHGDRSPSMRSARVRSIVRKKPSRRPAASPNAPPWGEGNLKASVGLSQSLPNLAELDDLEEGGVIEPVASKRHTFFPIHE